MKLADEIEKINKQSIQIKEIREEINETFKQLES